MSKASDYRNRPRLTVELTLPSGAVFTVRRPQLQVYAAAGLLPQSFIKWLEESRTNPQISITDAEFTDGMAFVRKVIIDCCVDPGVVADDVVPDETQIQFSELDEGDFKFLTGWIMAGAPSVPVKTEGGEVTHDDLSKFRQEQPGIGLADAGPDRTEILDPPLEVAGVAV